MTRLSHQSIPIKKSTPMLRELVKKDYVKIENKHLKTAKAKFAPIFQCLRKTC